MSAEMSVKTGCVCRTCIERRRTIYALLIADVYGSPPYAWIEEEYLFGQYRETEGSVGRGAMTTALRQLVGEGKAEMKSRGNKKYYRAKMATPASTAARREKVLAEMPQRLARARQLRVGGRWS